MQMRRREAIKRLIIGWMRRDKLALQVCGKLRHFHTVIHTNTFYFINIVLAVRQPFSRSNSRPSQVGICTPL